MAKYPLFHELSAVPQTKEEALAAIEKMVGAPKPERNYEYVGVRVGTEEHYAQALCRYVDLVAKIESGAKRISKAKVIDDTMGIRVPE